MNLYYSIILFEDVGRILDKPEHGIKDVNNKWPAEIFNWTDMTSSQAVNYYQISPDKWMPFKSWF